MSKEREALKQALELLAVATYQSPDLQQRRTDVINAGLSALAEQPAQQEPVAWIVEFDDGYVETTTRLVSDWKRGMWESAGKRFTVKPLYTSPQPAQQQESVFTFGEVERTMLALKTGTFEQQQAYEVMKDKPLYTRPQQYIEHCIWARSGNRPCPHVQPSKPLTDAQIGAVAADIWGSVLIAPQSYQAFARTIEQAHGITGETK